MSADFTANKDVLIDVLTGKYEAAELPDPKDLARKTVEGFLKGHEEMADRFRENITHAAFFDYANADGVMSQIDASRYLRNLPGVLEELKLPGDAERTRRIIAEELSDDGRFDVDKRANRRADLSVACRRIIAESEAGLDGVRAALINYHRECAANLLGEHARELGLYSPPDSLDPHRYLFSEDYAAAHIARAADYLIVGWKAGLLRESELEQAAFTLGHTSGAAQEALHQAAVAFDHDAYSEAHVRRSNSDWDSGLALELGVIAAVVVGWWRSEIVKEAIRKSTEAAAAKIVKEAVLKSTEAAAAKIVKEAVLKSTEAAVTETLRDFTLMESLSVGVPAGLAFIATAFLVAYLCNRFTSPHYDKKHNLIASEAANRTRLIEPSKPDDDGDDDERDGWIRVIAPPEPQDEDNEEDDDPDSARSEQESER